MEATFDSMQEPCASPALSSKTPIFQSIVTMHDASALLNTSSPAPYMIQIELCRPECANALSTSLATAIATFFSDLQLDACRAIILVGAGKHFCAGADLKERQNMTEAQWQVQHHALENAQMAVLNCPVPVIAAVHGAAFGGGLEMALACDLLVASESARFALSETTLGIMPGMGGTQLLSRRIGMARAKELIFTGRPFSAAEAYQWGMLNRVLDEASLRQEAVAIAAHIAQNAPLAIRSAKKAINEGFDLPMQQALRLELKHYNELLDTADRHEGICAFNEKRKPLFRGH